MVMELVEGGPLFHKIVELDCYTEESAGPTVGAGEFACDARGRYHSGGLDPLFFLDTLLRTISPQNWVAFHSSVLKLHSCVQLFRIDQYLRFSDTHFGVGRPHGRRRGGGLDPRKPSAELIPLITYFDQSNK